MFFPLNSLKTIILKNFEQYYFVTAGITVIMWAILYYASPYTDKSDLVSLAYSTLLISIFWMPAIAVIMLMCFYQYILLYFININVVIQLNLLLPYLRGTTDYSITLCLAGFVMVPSFISFCVFTFKYSTFLSMTKENGFTNIFKEFFGNLVSHSLWFNRSQALKGNIQQLLVNYLLIIPLKIFLLLFYLLWLIDGMDFILYRFLGVNHLLFFTGGFILLLLFSPLFLLMLVNTPAFPHYIATSDLILVLICLLWLSTILWNILSQYLLLQAQQRFFTISTSSDSQVPPEEIQHQLLEIRKFTTLSLKQLADIKQQIVENKHVESLENTKTTLSLIKKNIPQLPSLRVVNTADKQLYKRLKTELRVITQNINSLEYELSK